MEGPVIQKFEFNCLSCIACYSCAACSAAVVALRKGVSSIRKY